jgi:hypothetical protein
MKIDERRRIFSRARDMTLRNGLLLLVFMVLLSALLAGKY